MSPVAEIEPVIVQWCLLLANMGQLLTKASINELANEIIEGIFYSTRMTKFKLKSRIMDEKCVGILGYSGFISQCSDVLKRPK
jgi:hypothetical protein